MVGTACPIVDDPGVDDPDLERLFTEHAQPLYGFLAYRVGDPTVAEDLLGDTFERVVKSHGRFNARKGSEKTWIYTIALNCLRDYLRRTNAEGRALERSGVGEDHLAEHALEQVGEHDELMRALWLTSSPASARSSPCATARTCACRTSPSVTGLPSSTVQGRLYAGLRKLRDALRARSGICRQRVALGLAA